MKTGDKVYAWDPKRSAIDFCLISKELIIGEVDLIEDDRSECVIKSIFDGKYHRRNLEDVYEVGTGPVINSTRMDDYGDFNAYF